MPAGVKVAAASVAAKDTALVGLCTVVITRVIFIEEFFKLRNYKHDKQTSDLSRGLCSMDLLFLLC